MFDRSIGLIIGANTTQLQIGSPTGPVPDLTDLVATTSRSIARGSQCLEIREATAERAATGDRAVLPAAGRAGLLATLEWARRRQHHLVELGPVSLTIAEGQSILSRVVAFTDGWTAGPLALAITLDPTGSRRSTLAGQDNLDVRSHAVCRVRSRHGGRPHRRHDHR